MEVKIADFDNVVDWYYSKLRPDKPAEAAYALLRIGLLDGQRRPR